MSSPVVELKDVWKTYKLGKVEYPALRGINLTIKKGEFLALIGPSGCGKTTLLNIVGGLDRPSGGRIFVSGSEVNKMSESDLARFRVENVGFVFQFYNLIPTLTALENVELPLRIAKIPKDEAKKKGGELLKVLGLAGKEGNKPYELSGGEQQRVALARALANSPSIILADEPTGNLDRRTGREIIEMMVELNRAMGQTFVFATHSQDVIDHVSRAVMLRDGMVVKEMA